MEKVQSMMEKMRTIVEIEMQVMHRAESLDEIGSDRHSTPGKVSPNKHMSEPALPIGVGQNLDNMLMKGDLNIDEYCLKMSKLADDATESLDMSP